jgi:hypothetical protein
VLASAAMVSGARKISVAFSLAMNGATIATQSPAGTYPAKGTVHVTFEVEVQILLSFIQQELLLDCITR